MKDLTTPATGMAPLVPGTGLPATSAPLDHPEIWHRFYQDHQGPNRNPGYCQIKDASDDFLAVQYWLAKAKTGSQATYLNYRKEVNRFLAWAGITRHKRLSDITGADLADYQVFLRRPEPASLWVSRGGRPPKGFTGWRPPFTSRLGKPAAQASTLPADDHYGLSTESVVTAMAALKSLFTYLSAVDYLRGNPFKAIATPRPPQEADKVNRRNLSEVEVAFLFETIDLMPKTSDAERKAHARTRWLFHLLIYAGLRRSEVAKGCMGDFFVSPSGAFLRVRGKGKKIREVPVTIRLRQELAIYRSVLGASPWPSPTDESPLVVRLIGDDRAAASPSTANLEPPHIISPNTVWNIVKQTFRSAALRAEETGDDAMATSLAGMSTHWLRHTFGTEAMRRIGHPQKVQSLLGHANINTTMQYSHLARKDLAESMDAAYADTILIDGASGTD